MWNLSRHNKNRAYGSYNSSENNASTLSETYTLIIDSNNETYSLRYDMNEPYNNWSSWEVLYVGSWSGFTLTQDEDDLAISVFSCGPYEDQEFLSCVPKNVTDNNGTIGDHTFIWTTPSTYNVSCDSGTCLLSSSDTYLEITNKRITNTVGVPGSEYIMNKASGNTTKDILLNANKFKPITASSTATKALRQWNQSSDRAFPSMFNIKSKGQNVPSHGNSTKTSLTRHRPGAGGPPGKGVDIKHNSYHRYLLKKKGLLALQGENESIMDRNSNKIQNNKWKKDSIVKNMTHCCDNEPMEELSTEEEAEAVATPEEEEEAVVMLGVSEEEAVATLVITIASGDVSVGLTSTTVSSSDYSDSIHPSEIIGLQFTDITTVDDSAFYACTSLETVTFGDSLESIGAQAFNACTSLATVTFGDSLESIGVQAFSYCTSLTTVTLGDSLESIGVAAFYNCSSLATVTFGDYGLVEGESLTVGANAFVHWGSDPIYTLPPYTSGDGYTYSFTFTNFVTGSNDAVYLTTSDDLSAIDIADGASGTLEFTATIGGETGASFQINQA